MQKSISPQLQSIDNEISIMFSFNLFIGSWIDDLLHILIPWLFPSCHGNYCSLESLFVAEYLPGKFLCQVLWFCSIKSDSEV